MKRKSFRRLKSAAHSSDHHNVYVVLLSKRAHKDRTLLSTNPQRNPNLPAIYVGMTGLTPEERFANHKSGLKASPIVKKHGLRLLPEFYSVFNPMPFDAAVVMEKELAEELRTKGYTVAGGH